MEPVIKPTDTKGLYEIVVWGTRLFESVQTLSPGEYREPIAFRSVGPKPEKLKLLSLDLAYTYILSEDGSLQCLGTVLKLEPEVKVERINVPTEVAGALRAATIARQSAAGPTSSSSTAAAAGGQQPAADAKNVKGRYGAEWGMTTEQVTAAIGLPLGAPVKSGFADLNFYLGLEGDLEVTCYDVHKMPTDGRAARVRFCFGGKGQTGLMLVDRVLKPEEKFTFVRDELAARYGAPSSSGDSTFRGNRIERSKWLLPATEIHCGSNVRGDSTLTVTYFKRRPAQE